MVFVLVGVAGIGLGMMLWFSSGDALYIDDVGEIPLHASTARLYRDSGIVNVETQYRVSAQAIKAFYVITMHDYGWRLDRVEERVLFFSSPKRSGWLEIEFVNELIMCRQPFTRIKYEWVDDRPSTMYEPPHDRPSLQSTPIINIPDHYKLVDQEPDPERRGSLACPLY